MIRLLGLILLLSGCSQQDSHHFRQQELHTCLKSDPSTLDPRLNPDTVSEAVLKLLFTGLVDFDRNHEVRLALAEAYQISPDYKTYTFFLKKSFWSDGSPLTAEHFERKSGRVKALDARTLVIELDEPDPNLLNTLAQKPLYPIPKNVRKNPSERMGCGPFKIQSYTFQNQLVLERNPHYWDASSVRLEKIYFYIIKENFTALTMFDQGELDWVGAPLTELTADTIAALKKSVVLKMTPFPSLQQPYLKDVLPTADFRWAYLEEITELDQFRRSAKGGILKSFSK
jgi:oligopeptide transport system substrate-binding protein